ncbi:MAG: hypothetical protein AB7O32_14080 [Vicinamibacterales bacterium]
MLERAMNGSAGVPAVISPGRHAVLDYSVATTFLTAGVTFLPQHRDAATLAFLNGAMVLGMSLLTDYPGGVFRVLSFKQHWTGDILQAPWPASGRGSSASAVRRRPSSSTGRP